MKSIASPAMAAIEAGEAIVTGAVEFTPVAFGVAGGVVSLHWYQGTFDQTPLSPNDPARMGIAFLDEDDVQIGSITWSPLITVAIDAWTARALSAARPPDAVTVRLYQEFKRATGTSNDGRIDAITATANGAALTITNPGAETGNATGWTNEVGTITASNSVAGASGSWFFYGGPSDPLTRAYQDIALPALGPADEPADPIRLWGGYGPIEIDGEDYQGIGDRGLVQQTAGAIGGVAQGLVLSLSGIEPEALALLDGTELRGASVVIYRLIFASDGKTLLDAHVFDRGHVDTVETSEVIGAGAAIKVSVETTARGLGRAGARMRSDSDQRLINGSDGYFRNTAYAGEKTLYWGGRVPNHARGVLGGSTGSLGVFGAMIT